MGSSSAKARRPETKSSKATMTVWRSLVRRFSAEAFDLFNQTSLLVLAPTTHSSQWYGSAASRNPSPKKLKARTVMMILATGSISQGYKATTLMF
jgi:hypothetical protein